jgi:putative transcriptional regulator
MPNSRKYKSHDFAVIHDAASDLLEVGAINKTTLREFDAACIAMPEPLAPTNIQRLRRRLHVGQPVFAP